MEENEVFNSLGNLISDNFNSDELINISDEGISIVKIDNSTKQSKEENLEHSDSDIDKNNLIEIDDSGIIKDFSKNNTNSTNNSNIKPDINSDNNNSNGSSNDNTNNNSDDNDNDNYENLDKKNENNSNINEENENNVYKILANFLKEEGVVDKLPDDLEGNAEDIKKILVSKAEEIVSEWINNLPKEVKTIIEGYKEGIPLKELIEIKSEQIELNNITPESFKDEEIGEDLAKSIIYNYLKATTKLSDEKINKQIDRLVDIGDLVEEATSALEELKEIKKQEEEELKRKTEEEKKLQIEKAKEYQNKIENTIKEIKEIIPGVKISDKEKQIIIKNITTPAGYDEYGRPVSKAMQVRAKDPIKFEMMLNYFLEKGFFEGNFDSIMKKTETKVIKNLEKAVEAQAKLKQSGKSPEYFQNSNSKDLINSIKTLKF